MNIHIEFVSVVQIVCEKKVSMPRYMTMKRMNFIIKFIFFLMAIAIAPQLVSADTKVIGKGPGLFNVSSGLSI